VDPARDPRAGAGSALKRALRRWLKPPRVLRPTRAGWCFFAITFGVGFAALNTGNNLLYLVLSLMLAFLVLSGVLSESALRGIQIDRHLPREIFAGSANPVVLEIHNRQHRVAAFAIVVEDSLAGADGRRPAGRCFALRVGPAASETRRYAFKPERRGAVRFSGFRVSTRFPFGLFVKSLELEAVQPAWVYPAVRPLVMPPRLASTETEGSGTSRELGAGAVVSGLREFTRGDPARRIHWKSSLRRGALLVGEIDDEREAEIEVLLRTGPDLRGDFERRVSWAASEAVCHLEAGLRVALRTDDGYLPPDSGLHQRRRVLDFLARVEPGPTRHLIDSTRAQPVRSRAS